MAVMEARRQQPRAAHADPRGAARAGRDVARRRRRASCSARARRWERDNVEAPALLRHGGFLYLFYSAGHCCGRNCTYATGVARAQTLLGPWEKRRRPILRGGGAIRCPGHVGVTSGARRRAAPGLPRLRPRRSLEPAAVHDQRSGSAWTVGRPCRRTASRESRAAAISGWQWPAGPRPGVLGVEHRNGAPRRAPWRSQTGTTRFTRRHSGADIADRAARPSLAVTGSEGNAVGIELRGARAVAWCIGARTARITGTAAAPARPARRRRRPGDGCA